MYIPEKIFIEGKEWLTDDYAKSIFLSNAVFEKWSELKTALLEAGVKEGDLDEVIITLDLKATGYSLPDESYLKVITKGELERFDLDKNWVKSLDSSVWETENRPKTQTNRPTLRGNDENSPD